MPKTKYYFDGRYYQQKVRKTANAADGYITVRAKTVAEMDEKLAKLHYQKQTGMILGQKATCAEWVYTWWHNRTFSASVKSYRLPMINNVIAPAIGQKKVCDVKPEDIKSIMNSVSHRSESYCNKLYQLLNQLFTDARVNGLIAQNPCETIKYEGVPTAEKPAITAEQFHTLITAVEGTRAYLFCMIGYYTGMRREEICGLTWDDIHLDAPTPYIHVKNAVTWPSRSAPVYPSPLKTKNSNRLIPIHTSLLPALQNAHTSATSRFVIAGKDDSPLTYMSLRRLWTLVDDRTQIEYLPKSRISSYRAAPDKEKKKPNVEKTIDFYITPHILRHTFATNLIASGMDIKKAQYLTGHADISVLLKIYAHVKGAQPDELLGYINAAME